ncbi:MAG: pre-16S rRNA-processing nuclease YqgF [Gomphosphaeria aponina SAG 52.96 = DSM 107014]|uniref:Pre-16S rRNA-processing nuclease YqgF n=1 Tax=Gomphosphaeria aponina SAG 52.96 = DSM 107014 TaxID=1521640 RepID=A0A941JME4_9CHRO|nr:pre-16S rRNA-processing nuclease YqgF [Gomphosphaeria aponina SAG 52.96 = DSM 107014]
MMILGFDPGRDKCGVAVMGFDGRIFEHQVVSSEMAIATLNSWCQQFSIQLLVMGNQTTAKSWRAQISAQFPSLPIMMVDERNSSLEARDRYWQMYPPQGFTRLIPRGMRLPPRPVDDLVAILLIERYLQQTFTKPNTNKHGVGELENDAF